MLLAACTGPWNPRSARPPNRRSSAVPEMTPPQAARAATWGLDSATWVPDVDWKHRRTGKLAAGAHQKTITTIFISLKTHTQAFTQCTFAQAFKKNNRGRLQAAGCQRGTNTYQCWPPLQLSDTIQVHEYIKALKKKKTASIQVNKRPCAEKIYYWQHTGNTQY